MPYNRFSVPNRVHKLLHTDSCVMSCVIIIYNKRSSFSALYSFRIWQIQNLFLIKHALSTLSIHYWGFTHALTVLCVGDCNIIIYLLIYSAQLWAEKVSRLCTMELQIFMPRSLLTNRLKRYAWTDWQCHVTWTWLHIPSHSLLCPCYLPYNYICGWKLSGITINWLVYCSGLNFQQVISSLVYM